MAKTVPACQDTGLENRGPVKVLSDIKGILNDKEISIIELGVAHTFRPDTYLCLDSIDLN